MSAKPYHFQKWAPQTAKIAEDITKAIHTVAPELEVLFMGSAALKLPGKNDIDLDVLCPAQDVARYTELLSSVLGKPQGATKTTSTWNFMHEGFEVDCMLSDPAISHVPRQRKAFELLKHNGNLRQEYAQLKQSWEGLSTEECMKRRDTFFSRVLGG